MLDLTDADADREERDARRLAWIDTSAGIRFTHGSHRDEVIALRWTPIPRCAGRCTGARSVR